MEAQNANRYRYIVPVLHDDGQHQPTITLENDRITATAEDFRFTARCVQPTHVTAVSLNQSAANRNGMYDLYAFECDEPHFIVNLHITTTT